MADGNLGLSVEVSADIQQLVAGMAKASDTIKASTAKWQSGMDQQRTAIESAFRPVLRLQSLMGALAATGFALAIKGALDTAGALQDLSEQTGASTDTIQSLQHLLAQSGVNAQDSAAAIQKFTKNVGDAQNGSGELVAALKDTERAFLDLLRTAPTMDAALQIAFDRLAAMPDAAQRAALASDLFGKQGIKLAAIVKDGSIKFSELSRELARNGAILDKETIAKADAAGDELVALGRQLDVVKNNLILGLTPALLSSARAFNSWFASLKVTPQDEMGRLAVQIEAINTQMADLQARRANLQSGSAAGKIPESLAGAAVESIDKQTKSLEEQKAPLQQLLDDWRSKIQIDKEASQSADQLAASTGKHVAYIKQEADATSIAGENIKAFAKERQNALGIVQQLGGAEQNELELLNTLGGAYADGAVNAQEYEQTLDAVTRKHQEVTESGQQWAIGMQQLGLTFGDAFADAIVDGKSLHDVLQALEKDLLRMIIRGAVQQGIGSLFGLAASPKGGVLPGGVGAQPYANGGFIPPNSLALVGERGPELLAMGSMGAHITPNDQLGGGGTIVMNLDLRGVAASDIPIIDARIRAAAPQIAAASMAAGSDRRRRGGKG